MADQRVPLDLEATLEDCDPVIKSRVKIKLHVSFSASDGSKRNQDALEVYRDATMKLVEKLMRFQAGSDQARLRLSPALCPVPGRAWRYEHEYKRVRDARIIRLTARQAVALVICI